MARKLLAALALSVSVLWPVAAQEVELSWKFAAGQKFYQEVNTRTQQTIKLMNQEIKQEMDHTFYFSWNVKSASDKEVVIEQTVEAVRALVKLGASETKYDSTAKDATDNPLAGFFKPLVGATFTLTLDPNTMKITKVEGREDFVNKLAQANPQLGSLLRQVLSEDQMRSLAEPVFSITPGKGKKIKVGETWTRDSRLSMGAVGSYDAKYTYKYAGTEKKGDLVLHKIEITTDLKYKAPDAKEAVGLPFRIESGDLKTAKSSGVIYFDAEKGRIVETTMDVSLSGKLDISVGDQKSPVDLEQKQITVARYLDKNPVEVAAPTPK
ncbi:MAG: hypothetical protein C4297_03120 [Gemmataceae bacterium]